MASNIGSLIQKRFHEIVQDGKVTAAEAKKLEGLYKKASAEEKKFIDTEIRKNLCGPKKDRFQVDASLAQSHSPFMQKFFPEKTAKGVCQSPLAKLFGSLDKAMRSMNEIKGSALEALKPSADADLRVPGLGPRDAKPAGAGIGSIGTKSLPINPTDLGGEVAKDADPLQEVRARFQTIYEAELKLDQSLSKGGTVNIVFTIKPDGNVKDVRVTTAKDGGIKNKNLLDGIRKTIEKMHFQTTPKAKGDKIMRATYTFTFQHSSNISF